MLWTLIRWLLRLAAAGIAVLAAVLSAQTLHAFVARRHDPFDLGRGLLSAAVLFVCGWFAVLGEQRDARDQIRRALLWGLFFGFAAFLLGTVLPAILMSDPGQAPLLGVSVLGPLGFTAGVFLGALTGRSRRSTLGAEA